MPQQWDRRRDKDRTYHFAPYAALRSRLVRAVIAGVLLGVLVFSVIQLVNYGGDYVATRQAEDELRRLYYEDDQATAAPATATAAPTATPAPTETPVATEAAAVQATPVPTPVRLPEKRYPANPWAAVSERFQRLRNQNKDIIGWLTIEGMLDQAVVQRDNTYYLARDYRGYHNVNGALFLDQNCDLKTRPYTLLIYGHNMKTGAMFGNLRQYEKASFYRSNAFCTFDSMYESGEYVIFSACTVSLRKGDFDYLDFAGLSSLSPERRQEAITLLKARSHFSCQVDVAPEDQLLLMITCVDDENDRRIVAARRLREGESRETLQHLVQYSTQR